MRRSLLFNSAVYVLAQVVQKALGFILLIVYARFLLPEDFGITGTLSAYAVVLSSVFLLGLANSVVKHYFVHKAEPASLRSYLTTVFVFQILVAGTLASALDLWGEPMWERLTSAAIPFHPYVRIMLWTTFLSSVSMIPQAILRTEERAGVLFTWQLAHGILSVLLGVVFVAVLRQRALGVMRTQLLASAFLCALFVILFLRNWSSPKLQVRHLPKALAFGLPLLPHELGSVLMQTVDRMMLEKYAPLAEVGLYSIAMTLGMVLVMIAGGINQAWAPHFLRTMTEEPESEARPKAETFASLLVGLFAAASAVGGLLAPELARIVLGPKYVPAVPYLTLFLVGNLIVVYYTMPSNQLYLAEKTTWFLIATGVATVVSIGLNLHYLPRGGGAIAASWIFVVGNVCQTGIIALAAARYQRPLMGARHFVVFVATVGALLATRMPLVWYVRAALAGGVVMLVYVLLVRDNLRTALPAWALRRTRSSG